MRSSSGSGIAHAGSPASRMTPATSPATASVLPITPAVRRPSATDAAPVSVATSTTRSGLSAPDLASASAITSRPSASVFSTSTVLPP